MSSHRKIQVVSLHNIFPTFHFSFAFVTALAGLFFTLTSLLFCSPAEDWVGTWSTALQLVEPHNMPPEPGLKRNSLRQVVRVSLGGDSLRMRFSNEFRTSPVTLAAVHVAVSAGGSAIDTNTDTPLMFNGMPQVTMKPGAAVASDPFGFALKPRCDVTITIYFGDTSPDVTGHPGSRTTSFVLPGNKVSAAAFQGAAQTDHWYIINSIDVLAADSAAAVVVLGNSITDGRGSGTNNRIAGRMNWRGAFRRTQAPGAWPF